MNITHIKEVCLYIKNLESAVIFYGKKLEFHLQSYVKGRHAFFRAGNTMLLCFNPDDSRMKKSPPGHFAKGKQHLAFEVPAADYDKTKQSFQDKGIQIIDEVTWANKQKSFYFNDPEGNVLEIVPFGIWES